jgi:hypothetical protein
MKTVFGMLGIVFVAVLLTGCTTAGKFKTPEGAKLYIDRNPMPVEISADGTVTRSPFFWNDVSGIDYRLEKDGTIIQEGKLPSDFRIVSIFWPPCAIYYWPMGFESYTYDLTTDFFADKRK